MARSIFQALTGFEAYDEIRILSPLRKIIKKLNNNGITVATIPMQSLTSAIVRKYDITCIHGLFNHNLVGLLKNIDWTWWLDDKLWDVPKGNPIQLNQLKLDTISWGINNAKSIVCTTPELKKQCLWNWEQNQRKFLLQENCISKVAPLKKSENVLWAGGSSHTQDLELLNNYNLKRRITFFSTVLPSKLSSFERKPWGEVVQTPRYSHVGYIPTERSYEKYSTYMKNIPFSVGLCPLKPNDFNFSKSIWKVLEYAKYGGISVVSNIMPYAEIPDECVVKVDHDEWNESIEYAFANKNKIYKNMKEWIEEDYVYGGDKDKWYEKYCFI